MVSKECITMFSIRAIIFLVILILSSFLAYAQRNDKLDLNKGTLCNKTEEVVASCPLMNEKIVSLCNDSKVLTYRYGTGDNIEFSFSNIDNLHKFYFADTSGGSVNAKIIFFKSGNYRYAFADAGSMALTVTRLDENGNNNLFNEVCKYKFALSDEENKIYENAFIFPDESTLYDYFIEVEDFNY